MKTIESIEPLWREKASDVQTTITLKLGVKHRLDDLGKKTDTYENIITRMINENESLKKENDHLMSLVEKSNVNSRNIIEKHTSHRQYNSLPFTESIHIKFSYDLPDINKYENHSFNLRIEEIIWRNSIYNDIEGITKDRKLITKVNLWLISKLLIDEYDPFLEIPKKKNIIDPVFWKSIWKRIGLSMESYNIDIMGIINYYQERSDG